MVLTEQNTILGLLHSKYNKLALTKSELSIELGISPRTINNRMSLNMGLPDYIKTGNQKNSSVLFPIDAIADFMMTNRISTN